MGIYIINTINSENDMSNNIIFFDALLKRVAQDEKLDEKVKKQYLKNPFQEKGRYKYALPQEVIDAAIYCGINPENFEEAYCGEYESDADFAHEQADQCGMLEEDMAWPYTCIDWEFAARELMYDYEEHEGHYFRIL